MSAGVRPSILVGKEIAQLAALRDKDLPKEALDRMSPAELAKYMTTMYDCLSDAGKLQAQDIFRDNGMPGIADALRDYGLKA